MKALLREVLKEVLEGENARASRRRPSGQRTESRQGGQVPFLLEIREGDALRFAAAVRSA